MTRARSRCLGLPPPPTVGCGRGAARWLSYAVVPMLSTRSRRRKLLALLLTLLAPVGVSVSRAVATTQRGRLSPSRLTERLLHRHFQVWSVESTVRATLLWGVDGLDTSSVNLMRNSSYVGELEWADGFAFDEAAQAHVEHACERLRAASWVRYASDRRESRTSGSVQCFLDDFRAWLANSTTGSGFGAAFPVPDALQPTLALATFLSEPAGIDWQPYVGTRLSSASLLRCHLGGPARQAHCDASRGRAERRGRRRARRRARRARARLDRQSATERGRAVGVDARAAKLPHEAILGSVRTAGFAAAALLIVSTNLPLTLLTMSATFSATLSLLAMLVACGWALGSTEAVLANVTPAVLTPPAALIVRAYAKADLTGACAARSPPSRRPRRRSRAAGSPSPSPSLRCSRANSPPSSSSPRRSASLRCVSACGSPSSSRRCSPRLAPRRPRRCRWAARSRGRSPTCACDASSGWSSTATCVPPRVDRREQGSEA